MLTHVVLSSQCVALHGKPKASTRVAYCQTSSHGASDPRAAIVVCIYLYIRAGSAASKVTHLQMAWTSGWDCQSSAQWNSDLPLLLLQGSCVGQDSCERNKKVLAGHRVSSLTLAI